MKDAINIKTNAGAFKVDIKATATRIRHEVWFNGNAITNIVSFAEMADTYGVKYNHEQQTFMVMIPSVLMIFGECTTCMCTFLRMILRSLIEKNSEPSPM